MGGAGGQRGSTRGTVTSASGSRSDDMGKTHQVVNTALDGVRERKSFTLAGDDNDDFTGVKHGGDTHSEGHTRDLADVAVEEAGVREDGVVREGLDAGARRQAGSGLVERDVAVLADAAEEELDAAVRLDLGLVRLARADEVLGVAVEDVHLRGRDVDVREELAEHEGVVRLRVVLRELRVLVHVECHDMLESAGG